MSTTALYRIIVLHGAPKDSHTSTETYLVADSETAVADWINTNKKYGYWFGEDEDTPKTRLNEDCSADIPFRQWVMLKRGDLEDEEGLEHAYYGVTKWGWEPVAASPEDMEVLLRLGIAARTSQPEPAPAQ